MCLFRGEEGWYGQGKSGETEGELPAPGLGFALYALCGGVAGADPGALAAIEQQNEEQRIANKELERMLSDGTEEEYIERIAREKLGYAYPEEQVLIDISGS